jgi:hypothetical protein
MMGCSRLTNCIHLIKEDEAGLFAAGHLEQLTHHAGTLQDKKQHALSATACAKKSWAGQPPCKAGWCFGTCVLPSQSAELSYTLAPASAS